MFKRLQIRLYPTKEQEILLQRHVDVYRYLYNLCLEYKIHMYKYYKINKSGYDMQAEVFEIIKEIDWMKGLKVECLRNAALDVDKAFKNFFKGKGFPKFKAKNDKQSFTANQSIDIKKGKLSFFKQKIKFKTSEKYFEKLLNSKIQQCTFKKDKVGNWFATCLIEDAEIKDLSVTENKIGIDLGLSHFLITSDGEFIDNPKFLRKQEKKLRKLQRKHSKSKKGGKNREKLRIKVAKVFKKVTNQKQHFFHEVSNKLILENQEIHIED